MESAADRGRPPRAGDRPSARTAGGQLLNGGSIYASVAPEGRLIAAVFELQLQPETVVFDLAAEPPTWERFEFQGLPTGAGPYLLMTYWDSMVVLDAGLRPVGAPVVTPPDTRMFRPSPDGRFFAVSRANGALNLYRSVGELVAELRIPGATPATRSCSPVSPPTARASSGTPSVMGSGQSGTPRRSSASTAVATTSSSTRDPTGNTLYSGTRDRRLHGRAARYRHPRAGRASAGGIGHDE